MPLHPSGTSEENLVSLRCGLLQGSDQGSKQSFSRSRRDSLARHLESEKGNGRERKKVVI